MQNGKLTAVRVISSAVIGLTTVLAGAGLIYTGHAVPTELWAIGGLSIAGVVGADVAAAIYNRVRGGG